MIAIVAGTRRYECRPWGDGSSPDGFGNIFDTKDEVTVCKEIPLDLGRKIADWLEENHKDD